jgi:tRNA pseudouridine38-40 synthase
VVVRLRIDLAYDGTDFTGWAVQPGLRTVQGELERALATVLRLPSVRVVCAGRTDTGVHARGQVVHVDVPAEALFEDHVALARRVNGALAARDVVVRRMADAPFGFDARFSPLWRRYTYRICDGVPDPLTRNHVLSWPRPLDIDAMNEASATLVGLHDFASFCRRRDGATTVRTLLDLSWVRSGEVLVGTVRADAFCHQMVRSLVGCLVAVGDGRRSVAWASEILGAGARDAGVKVVAARGLTLEEVAYPDDAALAARAEETRRRRG